MLRPVGPFSRTRDQSTAMARVRPAQESTAVAGGRARNTIEAWVVECEVSGG
jgi:hypothetical protein